MTFDGVSEAAMAAYQQFDTLTGGAPDVISSYRSPEHNARVGGAKNSQHTHGNAFDFNVSGMPVGERIELINKARQTGFKGVGVYDNTLHFDVGGERAWGPSHSRDSLPEWYLNAFGGQQQPKGPPVASQPPENRLMALASAAPEWRGGINPGIFGL